MGPRLQIFQETNTVDLHALLGDDAESLLNHTCAGITKEQIHVPGPDFIDRVTAASDRSPQVLRNLGSLYNHGRLAGTGYVSILPVDQGIEHSAAASFAPNPDFFDPVKIIELAIAAECNAVATTLGALGLAAALLLAPAALITSQAALAGRDEDPKPGPAAPPAQAKLDPAKIDDLFRRARHGADMFMDVQGRVNALGTIS